MKTLVLVLLALFLAGTCLADIIKGSIDKVDIKNYELTVGGRKVGISKATVFTVNDIGVTKVVITRDLKDHQGEDAVCYGSFDKDGVMDAYKVRVKEGHK